jgi:hypothetical protein
MDMHPPSDHELDTLPQVVLTSNANWDPNMADNEIEPDDVLYNTLDTEASPGTRAYGDTKFDQHGYYRQHVLSLRHSPLISQDTLDDVLEYVATMESFQDAVAYPYDVNASRTTTDAPIEYDELRRFFGWIPTATIKHTFDCTTRWACYSGHYPLRKHFKSRFPSLNVHQRQEAVASDTIFSDTPAVDNGSTCAQIFVGMDTLVTDAYGIKSDGEFVSTLEDNIRKLGAMSKLVSDCAQSEVSNKVLDILRNYMIDDWQSEPYHEQQNPAKRRYQTVKQHTNAVLDKTGAPPKARLLALLYAIFLLNHVASESLGWKTPLELLTVLTTDISIILMFSFWEPIYFPTGYALFYAHKPGFPSDTAERVGRFVGVGESVGDALTFQNSH